MKQQILSILLAGRLTPAEADEIIDAVRSRVRPDFSVGETLPPVTYARGLYIYLGAYLHFIAHVPPGSARVGPGRYVAPNGDTFKHVGTFDQLRGLSRDASIIVGPGVSLTVAERMYLGTFSACTSS